MGLVMVMVKILEMIMKVKKIYHVNRPKKKMDCKEKLNSVTGVQNENDNNRNTIDTFSNYL